jgi:hypothetical protein
VNGPELKGTRTVNDCVIGALALNGNPAFSWPPPALPAGMMSADTNFDCGKPATVTLSITPDNNQPWNYASAKDPDCGTCTSAPAPLYKAVWIASKTNDMSPTAVAPTPVCPGGRSALLVPNYEPTTLGQPPVGYSLACPGSALYHCYLDWGFVPGTPEYAACGRAITADYCGDGHPSTVTGVPIFLHTGATAPRTVEYARAPEATWDENGATCVATPRVDYIGTTSQKVLDYLMQNCASRVKASCTATQATRLVTYTSIARSSVLCQSSPNCMHGHRAPFGDPSPDSALPLIESRP